jgi:DNA processing protein
MPLGLVVVEGARYSGSLITARLAIEFAREVFAVPGNVTQPVSFAPNLLIKQGAKLVTNGDEIEELPAAIRAVLVKAQQKEAEQLNLLAANRSIPARERSLSCSRMDEHRHINNIVEQSGLHSSEDLATLFDLEMKGLIRPLPGKQFSKVLLWRRNLLKLKALCDTLEEP